MKETAILNDESLLLGLALKEAEYAYKIGEIPVGAVIVDCFGNIMGYGYNRTIIDSDPTAHAEIVAIRSVTKNIRNYRIPGMRMYVTLEPCLMCIGAIFSARIERVVYGAKDYKTGSCGTVFNIPSLKKINHQTSVFQSKENISLDCGYILSNFLKKYVLILFNIRLFIFYM